MTKPALETRGAASDRTVALAFALCAGPGALALLVALLAVWACR